VSVRDEGTTIRTIEWKDCEITPMIHLPAKGNGDPTRVDPAIGQYVEWDWMKRYVDEFGRTRVNSSAKDLRKKARGIEEEALGCEQRALRVRGNLTAAEKLTESVQRLAEQITWRSIGVGVNAATESRGNQADVERLLGDAALGFIRSGTYYHLGDAPDRAAERLCRAVKILFDLGRYDEAAVWAETAGRLDDRIRQSQAEAAAKAWLESVRKGDPRQGPYVPLFLALKDAWSAKAWGVYVEGMRMLGNIHEDAYDYAAVAADLVCVAWASLQEGRRTEWNARRAEVALDDAAAAWGVVGQGELAVAAGYYARRAEGLSGTITRR
jgi:hypothetical protein